MSRRAWNALGFGAAALLFLLHALTAGPPLAAGPEPGPVRRLFGPFAGLAAELQWVRFNRARGAGREELAIAHAETAIELDPSAARGYELFALHLALDQGSAESEPDPERRAAWLAAGLAVAARGEAHADDPGALAFLQGFLLHVKAEADPELVWPGGAAELWRQAAQHYARAAALGHPGADAAAAYARERAGAD